ncbi:hypothetical protein DSM100238_1181 [Bifidobacterium apri]|uniref:Uncharacterized protein n=1 Tax=Bifidobacterium apri TaxID=1769423 RepID=A0A6A2VHA8_9BIFI|nr:hypothetical protein DSM100238_1181 [Bifidobacterium apri]
MTSVGKHMQAVYGQIMVSNICTNRLVSWSHRYMHGSCGTYGEGNHEYFH